MHVVHRAASLWAVAFSLGSSALAQPAARTADSLFSAHDYQRAVAAYQSLLRSDSTVARYWYQLGLAAANLGKYELGVVAFEHAAVLAPGPAAVYNVGAMHARMNHADAAFDWLNRAVKAGFANAGLLQTDDDLASIHSDARFATLVAAVTKAAAPCVSDADHRRFDFWVGEWDVTTNGGAPVGSSVIQSVSNGCALLENWTAGNGGSGKSLNTYDPQKKQWVQFWVGSGGGITEYSESEWHDGAVTFHARPAAQGYPHQRLTFTPLDASTVRQFGELSTDGGKTWTVGYDFYYHRKR